MLALLLPHFIPLNPLLLFPKVICPDLIDMSLQSQALIPGEGRLRNQVLLSRSLVYRVLLYISTQITSLFLPVDSNCTLTSK